MGSLDGHLGYYIRRVQVWVFQDFIRSLAPLEIRPAQYSVRARLVHVLDKLEKRGLTERQESPNDRRSHALHLTPEGHKLLKQAKALAARHEANLIKRLGEDNYKATLGIFREFGERA
jgi:DNA-binding MarR family transcriptional regulator